MSPLGGKRTLAVQLIGYSAKRNGMELSDPCRALAVECGNDAQSINGHTARVHQVRCVLDEFVELLAIKPRMAWAKF